MTHMPALGKAHLAFVTVPAELDATNADRIGQRITAAILDPAIRVIIADMTGTTFCDSTAVRMLIIVNKHAATHHTHLRLLGPNPSVSRLLSLTGADLLLPVYPTLEQALKPPS